MAILTDTSTPTENPAPSPQPAILTTTAAATYLGLDPAAVRELCRTGAFPHAARRPPSGHWRIPLADLQQWRQDHPTPVAPAPTAQPASLRRLGSQVVAAVVFLAAIAAIISAAPIVADWVTPLLAAAPPPLPPEEFNVVVAGFGTRLADDSVTQSQAADDAGDMIFRAVSAVPEVDNARSWRAIPNGRILAVTPAEQDARALKAPLPPPPARTPRERPALGNLWRASRSSMSWPATPPYAKTIWGARWSSMALPSRRGRATHARWWARLYAVPDGAGWVASSLHKPRSRGLARGVRRRPRGERNLRPARGP